MGQGWSQRNDCCVTNLVWHASVVLRTVRVGLLRAQIQLRVYVMFSLTPFPCERLCVVSRCWTNFTGKVAVGVAH